MPYLVHHLLAETAAKDPEQEAMRFRGRSLSYGEYDAQANALARALIDAGVRRGDRVAIRAPKRIETMVSLYGVMKAGAAYVPMDPNVPEERSTGILEQCSVRAMVTTPSLAGTLLDSAPDALPEVLVLIDDGIPVASGVPAGSIAFDEAVAAPATDPEVPMVEDDLAAIIFTSGSTGIPKGAMQTHRSLVASALRLEEALGATADDRFSGILPLHFAASVLEVLLPPRVGASLVLVPGEDVMMPQALERAFAEENLTATLMVPSLVRTVMGASPNENPFPTLRVMVFGGEEFPSPQVRELMRRSPDVTLFNVYAGTETMIRTLYRLDSPPEEDERLPLGRPLANTELIVFRDDGEVASPGEEGELCVRGTAVSPGYWRDPEKTAAAFVEYPFQPELGARMYRTGDRVRIRPDGVLEHAGRVDDQIKSRGVRIELGEIDTAASAYRSIAEAAAVAVPHETWGSMIVLCVTPRAGSELDESDLKRFLGAKLPAAMVPAEIRILPELPKGATGKTDRLRLTELVAASIEGEG